MRFFIPFLFLTLFAPMTIAVVNGTSVTVSGTTTCNNGATERTVAGTMTTNCGAGWEVGPLPPPPVYAPRIHYTDIISGPDTGLGDGLGSGAIVTVWGQNLGTSQGSNTIEFCDSLSVCRSGYVYYWKNANGTLPGGPANLYESHGMQEIAFSIPDSALGTGRIKIVVNGVEATTNTGGDLSFTVRSGRILHVASTGDNANYSTSVCSFAQPCAWVNGNIDSGASGVAASGLGNSRLQAGDIVYSRGVQEPTYTAGDGRSSGMYLRDATGSLTNQIVTVAYPGGSDFSRVTSQGYGVQNLAGNAAIVTSKYIISVGHADPTDPPNNGGNSQFSDIHIGTTPNGRAVGNLMVQNVNTCFTGQGGTISSGGQSGDNYKIFGNHMKDLGCDNSSRYQHTLYLTVRDPAASITAWEIAYNYLDNNNVLNGIHIFDQEYTTDCGDLTGTLKIYGNVIVNQRGAGIFVNANDFASPVGFCWSADIEVDNNVLINVGQGVAAEDNATNPTAIFVGGGINSSTVKIRNNTVYGWGEATSFTSGPNNQEGFAANINFNLADPAVTVSNNSFIQTTTNQYVRWFGGSEPNLTVTNTNFWNTVSGDGNSNPTYTGNIVADPLYTITGSQLTLSGSSPLINAGSTPVFEVDVYGKPGGTNVGAVQ